MFILKIYITRTKSMKYFADCIDIVSKNTLKKCDSTASNSRNHVRVYLCLYAVIRIQFFIYQAKDIVD